MATSSALLHPVRLRIVQTLLSDGELTTRDLHARLPDVPIATLYRHVGHLVKHEFIEVCGEQRIRGAQERTYRLAAGIDNPTPEDVAALSAEELLTAFTVFTSGIIRDFETYLRAGEPDLKADRVSFAQAAFWASEAELDDFADVLIAALEPLRLNGPAPDRRRRILSTVLLPKTSPAPGEDSHQ